MMRLAPLFALAFAASPATAQNSAFCQEIWLGRNTVMDRAGQCFQTPLGQAVFDNSDCVEGGIRLNPLDAQIVQVATDIERWAECTVDTDAERLSPDVLPFHARLMELFTIPVRIDGEFGCIGYQGPPIPLFVGISTNMTVLGMVEPGHSFNSSHYRVRGGWEYLEVRDAEGTPIAHGWAQGLPGDISSICEFSAG